jgi:hypothetical protein
MTHRQTSSSRNLEVEFKKTKVLINFSQISKKAFAEACFLWLDFGFSGLQFQRIYLLKLEKTDEQKMFQLLQMFHDNISEDQIKYKHAIIFQTIRKCISRNPSWSPIVRPIF